MGIDIGKGKFKGQSSDSREYVDYLVSKRMGEYEAHMTGERNRHGAEEIDYAGEVQAENVCQAIDLTAKVHTEHAWDKENPHGVTKKQLGLENVDNTSDEDKPVSKAVQNALSGLSLRVSANNEAITENKSAIQANSRAIAENVAAIQTNSKAIAENTSAISANNEAVGANAAALNAHKSDLGAHSEVLARERSSSNRQYANAIRGTVRGAAVRADDVSPVAHGVKVKVSSKNLFDVRELADGLFYYEDGSDATADDFDYFKTEMYNYENCFPSFSFAVQPGETYEISGYARKVYNNADIVAMFHTSEELEAVEGEMLSTCPPDEITDAWTPFSLSVTIPDDVTLVYLYLSLCIAYKDIVLKKDIDPSGVTLTASGKNLFDVAKADVLYYDADGNEVTSNDEWDYFKSRVDLWTTGTYELNVTPGETYTISFDVHTPTATNPGTGLLFAINTRPSYSSGTKALTRLISQSMIDGWVEKACVASFTAPEDAEVLYFITGENNMYRNLQIELGDSATDYEPCFGVRSYAPDENGTAELASVSPVMTIFPNAAGVEVEAEYNRDMNMVIGELANAIISMGGTL